jgi:hypothetical protein
MGRLIRKIACVLVVAAIVPGGSAAWACKSFLCGAQTITDVTFPTGCTKGHDNVFATGKATWYADASGGLKAYYEKEVLIYNTVTLDVYVTSGMNEGNFNCTPTGCPGNSFWEQTTVSTTACQVPSGTHVRGRMYTGYNRDSNGNYQVPTPDDSPNETIAP